MDRMVPNPATFEDAQWQIRDVIARSSKSIPKSNVTDENQLQDTDDDDDAGIKKQRTRRIRLKVMEEDDGDVSDVTNGNDMSESNEEESSGEQKSK